LYLQRLRLVRSVTYHRYGFQLSPPTFSSRIAHSTNSSITCFHVWYHGERRTSKPWAPFSSPSIIYIPSLCLIY
jgi:hypothetical protein